MKEKYKKIINTSLIILLGILLVLIVLPLFPIPGNYRIMMVMSGSMEPAIGTGSLVVVKPKATYEVGDVITFSFSSGNQITHRIVDMDNGEFITQGDANESPDVRKVSKDRVIGRVLFDLPWLGYLAAFAKSLPGLVLFIILPALYILISESRKIYVTIRDMKNG